MSTSNRPTGSDALRSSDSADQVVELSAIAGGLAHEIRNALSTLRVNLQLLDEDWGDLERDPEQSPTNVARRSRTRISTLLKESQRLETILDDFLEFVRRRELKLSSVDLNEIVGDIVAFFRPQADRYKIDLHFEPTAEPLICRVDSGLLKQSLLNVIINAQQAIESEGRINVTLRQDERFAVIGIADDGPGIDPDNLSQIFQAYYSTRKGGSGLGLAMTRRIIRAHGGRVEVDSRLGEGTSFSFYLPLDSNESTTTEQG